MASKMVMAWGENGLEQTPIDEVVEIAAFPVGDGNITIPATLECMSNFPAGGHIPTRLVGIEPRDNGAIYARFECTPFVRYTKRNGTPAAYGNTTGCTIRNMTDATHRVFSELPDAERAQLVDALKF